MAIKLHEPNDLEQIVDAEITAAEISSVDIVALQRKEKRVDQTAAISYSIVIGAVVDLLTGLNAVGIITSRLISAGVNYIIGDKYGKYRDFWYRKTKTTYESSRIKQWLVETYGVSVSFNTPLYTAVVAIGSLVSEEEINLEKVENASYLVLITSPLIGPTLGWWYNRMRKWFGLQTAQEKVEKYVNLQS
ncbi:L-alanine exporter AlaE [Candidatus Woesearchaeota archaeon]|nr:L-alanine exporter AlaE [Candidatus Woesearchaeota archaeon]